MRSIIKIFFLALLTVLVMIVVIKLNYNKAIETPNSDNSEKITIQINSGESVDSIVDKLVEYGLLREKWSNYFKLYLKLENVSEKIQAGIYKIPQDLSIKEIAQTIQQARGLDIWITIPEGLRKDEIAEILNRELTKGGNTLFEKDTFLSLTTDKEFILTFGFPYQLTDLEGYLFPDKYAFSKESMTADILKSMITNFKTKTDLKDTYNDLIIASLVEREGYNADDRAMIADILKRRLTEGWLLEIDASLLYPQKDWTHVITNEDKAKDNPYNTYKKAGLPPTPICNPGLEAINATRNPKENNYYFYIHDTQGNVHFAETYAEHNRNVQEYLR